MERKDGEGGAWVFLFPEDTNLVCAGGRSERGALRCGAVRWAEATFRVRER